MSHTRKASTIEGKNLGGRPRKFQDIETFENLLTDYFASCWDVDEETGRKMQIEPYTITGLAIALDTTRQVLLDYQNDPNLKEFTDSIKKAKMIVENYAETQLFKSKNVAGVIFNMKNNYGWKDVTEQKQDVNLQGSLNLKDLPDDNLLKKASQLTK